MHDADRPAREAEKFILDDMAMENPAAEVTTESEAEPADMDGRGLYLNNCGACHGPVGERQDGW